MNHRTGLDRSQTLLFPERLEDYVAADNPVRFLDAFVASLDLHGLQFAKAKCANTGRPPYAPAVLLKLYLYGYLHRVRSSRMLEAEAHRNVEVIWLLGKLTPDFKTIADFRKDNLKPLQGVARQFTLLCRKLELFGGELLAIDGSKFRAVNARDQNFSAAKLQELLAHTDARLAEYFNTLDQADAAAPEAPSLDVAALQAKIAALQARRDWHAELLGQLDAEEKQISVTDPDTRRMPVAQGNVVGYNAQMAVDAMEKQLEKHHHEALAPAHALQSLADALPALGIVAAVLGIIKTMGSITQPPEILGEMIGSALVGTFLGVFMAYGLVGPMSTRLGAVVDEDASFYKIIRTVLVAHLHGNAAQISVEIGRGGVPSGSQPSFAQLEETLTQIPAEAA